MTAIAAIKENNKVWMAADSKSTGSWNCTETTTPKIVQVGKLLIGCCGSWRILNLLEFGDGSTNLAKLTPKANGMQFMVQEVVPMVRKLLYDNGCLQVRENQQRTDDSYCLFAFDKRLYKMLPSFSVIEHATNYSAIGSGEELAMGSLYTSELFCDDPQHRLRLAIQAASKFNAAVGGKIIIRSTK